MGDIFSALYVWSHPRVYYYTDSTESARTSYTDSTEYTGESSTKSTEGRLPDWKIGLILLAALLGPCVIGLCVFLVVFGIKKCRAKRALKRSQPQQNTNESPDLEKQPTTCSDKTIVDPLPPAPAVLAPMSETSSIFSMKTIFHPTSIYRADESRSQDQP